MSTFLLFLAPESTTGVSLRTAFGRRLIAFRLAIAISIVVGGAAWVAPADATVVDNPVSFSVNGPTGQLPGFDGPPPPGVGYFPGPWFPPPPYSAGPTGVNRWPTAPQAVGINTPRSGDVEDYNATGQWSEAEIFQSEPDLGVAGPPTGTNNQVLRALELGLLPGDANVNAYTFGEDFFTGLEFPESVYVAEVYDEPWEFRAQLDGFMEPVVNFDDVPISFYFSVDPFAVGRQPSAVFDQATLFGALTLPAGPPGSADPELNPGWWESDGEASGDVFVASPVSSPGTNTLIHDHSKLALLAPRLPGPTVAFEDDLDAMECVGPNAGGEPGNTHDRINPIVGTHPPELGDPFMSQHEPVNQRPVIFSVDRRSTGAPGSAVEAQTIQPVEGASGDLFMAVVIQPPSPFAGKVTNMLLVDEGMLGLMPHDDLDAVAMQLLIDPLELEFRIQEASSFYQFEFSDGPGFTLPLLQPGEAWIAFSVDAGSIGLVQTAIDYECRVDGSGLVGPGWTGSGVMEQAGDLFYCDLLPLPNQGALDPGTGYPYGQNYLWFEEGQLGLDRGGWSFIPPGPSGHLDDSPDELNALDTDEMLEELGACCFFDGSCLDLPVNDCLNQGGVPGGPGSTCVGSLIACCQPDGTCVDTVGVCCNVLGGTPSPYGPACLGDQDGSGIDDACECPCDADLDGNGFISINDFLIFTSCFGLPPTGNCQDADLNCDGVIDPYDFGIFHCQFYSLNPDECCVLQLGACCLPSGECRETSSGQCAGLGGSFEGVGIVCGALTTQACCLPDGSCIPADPFCCVQEYNGTPLGDGTVCSPEEACCLPGGTCSMADPQCCEDVLGGTAQGPGTSCTTAEPCCQPDGTCVMLDPLCCAEIGGSPSPFGAPACLGDLNGNNIDDACEDPLPPEACCLPDDTCQMLPPPDCFNLGGVPQGQGSQCTAPEACCLPSGNCIMIDPVCCDDLGGVPQGPGSQCGPVLEPCCLHDGTCIMADPLCCAELGGTQSPIGAPACMGDGNGNNIDDACEEPLPPEACCLPDDTCQMLPPPDCFNLGGVPQGPGSQCTAPEACCLPGGNCIMIDPVCCDDLGGVPQGPGSQCAPAPEPCCLPNGVCAMIDPNCCDELGGTPSPTGSPVCQGDGNGNGVDDACEILQPLQACCLPDGTCAMLAHNDCVNQGGDPQGPQATDCQQVVCTPIKWAQPPTFNPASPFPECFWGWDEYSVYGSPQWIVADDWLCMDEAPVSDVHWWGSYMDWDGIDPPPVAPEAFHLGIWTDVPAGVDQPFSHPGMMIWEWVVPRDLLNERPVACDFHPQFMNVPDGCFKYDFVIDPPLWFIQEPACNIYWISISALYGGSTPCPCNGDIDGDGVITLIDVSFVSMLQNCTPGAGDPLCDASDVDCDGDVDEVDIDIVNCQFAMGFPDPTCCNSAPPSHPWGWKTREHMFNDDAVRIFFPTAPIPGMPYEFGEPIEDETGLSWDMAFVLTSDQCPSVDMPLPDHFSAPCVTDLDCHNQSVCVHGGCYVPRNKYLSFAPGNAGQQVALKVTLKDSAQFPWAVDSSWWVQPHDPGDPPDVYRLGCAPHYDDWQLRPNMIHVTDVHITTAAEYDVQAIPIGCDTNLPSSYSPPLTLPTHSVWGDVVGEVLAGVSQPPDGNANLGDVQLIIKCWQNEPFAPPLDWADIDGDPPNAVVNLADAFRAAQAFQGQTYPYGGPVPCP